MKKIVFLLALIISFGANAQNLVLTQSANEPAIGDTSRTYRMDTTYYASGLPVGAGGDDLTWDFSGLSVTSTINTQAFIDPATLTITIPAGCNLVQKQGNSLTYLKSTITPSTQTELVGVNLGTISVTFTNTGIIARYPVAFGYSLSDNYSGSVGGTITVSGNITGNADGRGTLILPYGNVFNNVLRVRTVQTTNALAYFIIPLANIKQTNFQYFHASSKFPIMTISRSVSTFSNDTVYTVQTNVNKELLVVNVSEHLKNELPFSLFPNPASDVIRMQLSSNEQAEHTEIKDCLGRTVISVNHTNSIDIGSLPPGVYMLQVSHQGAKGSRRLVKAQ